MSFSKGSLAKAAIPIEDGWGAVMKQSFSEMGSPCSGPKVFPFCSRYSSRYFARSNASGNSTSVTQLVNCCARAEALQNALVTSVEVQILSLIFWRISSASDWMISTSSVA